MNTVINITIYSIFCFSQFKFKICESKCISGTLYFQKSLNNKKNNL